MFKGDNKSMEKEVVVIGAGLSGLTCAALLAKKGLKVKVIETQFKPGGSCGIFKRNDVIFFPFFAYKPPQHICFRLEGVKYASKILS